MYIAIAVAAWLLGLRLGWQELFLVAACCLIALVIAVGFVLFAASNFMNIYMTTDYATDQLFWPNVVRAIGQALVMTPLSAVATAGIEPENAGSASGLFNMMRNLGGAVGIAVCGAILNTRTNFHFDGIAYHLTPANGAMARMVDGIAQRYGALPGNLDAGHVAALKELWHLAYREASTLAFADAFHAIMVAFLVATLLVPMLRQVGPAKTPPADSH